MKVVVRPLSDVTDASIDLNDFCRGDGQLFVRDGVGVAGRGVAARVSGREHQAFFDSLVIDAPSDAPGARPLLIGALPFDRTQDAQFVMPSTWIAKTDNGRAWFGAVDGATIDVSTPQSPRPMSNG
ncbi:MAG: hypothetical protein ACKOQZ_09865, partial [Actinomycetota bacterium]